jgi:hypothetical protein
MRAIKRKSRQRRKKNLLYSRKMKRRNNISARIS